MYILMIMNTTQSLQKWGNSLAVRIPKKVIEATNARINQEYIISVEKESIILTPSKKSKAKSVEEMFKGVHAEDVGGELDWGPDVGAEKIDEDR